MEQIQMARQRQHQLDKIIIINHYLKIKQFIIVIINTQINKAFAARVLHRIVVSQLMFHRIQHKPPLLPGFEQGTSFV